MTVEKSCKVEMCCSDTGYVFRIVGRGTLRESPAVRDFVSGAMEDGADVVIDLSQCEYLDSTFLGCLAILHQRGSFKVFASDLVRRRLFGSSHLDRILVFAQQLPESLGDSVVLQVTELERKEFCQHLLNTHRKMAKLGGPSAETFQRIVKQLQKEMDEL